ncbi:MAG: phosphopentomutase [Chthonomonas sp.]|nr:phosphopentomutase [Chthonomonas sp.]
MKRAIVIVLDGCGAGATADAADYNDPHQPNTLGHVWEKTGPLNTPNLERLGWWRTVGVGGDPAPEAGFARLIPLSKGKDSVTGHWEMMGIVLERPFPTFPNGFPIPLIKQFESRIGTQTLANRAASGTAIINELGELHCDTGFPIVYTSADSVFQIAAHEDKVPIEQLYEWCHIARELCVGPHEVQRVIARPFIGEPGAYKRTERRKDFPVQAPPNLLDRLEQPTFGIGVVPELFDGRGFRSVRRTQNNAEHAVMMREALASDASFIFANFEDTDMLFGHRNDAPGFGKCLEDFDVFLGELLAKLGSDDMLIITADHGNDPTDTSTDHTREMSPVAMWGGPRGELGTLEGLAHVGDWVAAHLK